MLSLPFSHMPTQAPYQTLLKAGLIAQADFGPHGNRSEMLAAAWGVEAMSRLFGDKKLDAVNIPYAKMFVSEQRRKHSAAQQQCHNLRRRRCCRPWPLLPPLRPAGNETWRTEWPRPRSSCSRRQQHGFVGRCARRCRARNLSAIESAVRTTTTAGGWSDQADDRARVHLRHLGIPGGRRVRVLLARTTTMACHHCLW